MVNRDDIKAILRDRGYVEENNFRHYSVLIPLIDTADGIRVLYEVRAKDLDRQPGEICFPGGEVEPGESCEECAIRETFEEIGIPSEEIEILRELTTIYGIGRFAMHCYPAILDAKAMDSLRLNEEVGEVFTVSLDELMDTECEMYRATLIQEGPEDFPYEKVTGSSGYDWSRLTSPVPVYYIDGRAIWGLTGRATKVLIEALGGNS